MRIPSLRLATFSENQRSISSFWSMRETDIRIHVLRSTDDEIATIFVMTNSENRSHFPRRDNARFLHNTMPFMFDWPILRIGTWKGENFNRRQYRHRNERPDRRTLRRRNHRSKFFRFRFDFGKSFFGRFDDIFGFHVSMMNRLPAAAVFRSAGRMPADVTEKRVAEVPNAI